MEDQGRVVKIVPGILGETVAAVPLAQDGHGLVHVLGEHAELAVALQQAAQLRFREAQRLVELRAQADVGADVEAAGHAGHGDRRHAAVTKMRSMPPCPVPALRVAKKLW